MNRDYLKNLIKTTHPILLIESAEYYRIERELISLCESLKKEAAEKQDKMFQREFLAWSFGKSVGFGSQINDPVTLIKKLNETENVVVLLPNFNKFWKDAEVLQQLINAAERWRAYGITAVVISPIVDVPVELSRLVTIVEWELPSESDLKSMLETLLDGIKAEQKDGRHKNVVIPSEDEKIVLIEAARGLSEFEAENAFALSLAQGKGVMDPKAVFETKCQTIKKSNVLTVGKYTETFDDIGGLDILKDFLTHTTKSKHSRGVLLLGVAGTGKSSVAKAVGNALGVPTIYFDISKVFTSFVGASEMAMRDALKTIDAVGKAVIFIDEIEKGLSGITSSGSSDGGTTARVFGSFLTWLSDREEGSSFIIATCNNIDELPPEFLRAERWDAIFFIDLPNAAERETIRKIYEKKSGVSLTEVDLTNWTGAEIKTLTRISRMLNKKPSEAKKYIMPIHKRHEDKINALREFAKTAAVPASSPEARANTRSIGVG